MNVYFRIEEGTGLGVFEVGTDDHVEAIATVAEEMGGKVKGPFLALINGGGSSC